MAAARVHPLPTTSEHTFPDHSQYPESTCSCVSLVVLGLFLILASLCMTACLKTDSSLPSFFKDIRDGLAHIASRTDTTPFQVSLFMFILGGVGTIGCTIWRAKLCCKDARKGRDNVHRDTLFDQSGRGHRDTTITSNAGHRDTTTRSPSDEKAHQDHLKAFAEQSRALFSGPDADESDLT